MLSLHIAEEVNFTLCLSDTGASHQRQARKWPQLSNVIMRFPDTVHVLSNHRKCMEDRFDSMVQLIQKVLQLYAAKTLQTAETDGVEGALNQVRTELCMGQFQAAWVW